MTNAEKIAKDTDFLVELLLSYNCDLYECTETSCPIYKKFGKCLGYSVFDDSSLRQYLESEVEHD